MTETRNCQNCKQDFTIEPEDFLFYEKIKVPPPTWCPTCRMQRRLVWRNERNLYKRKCDAPGHTETIISMYSEDAAVPVYDQKYWHGDGWDSGEYARTYDFSRSFFEQWKELLYSVPTPALINLQDVASDYCNFTYQSKNCYLNFASDINEDTEYLYHSIENRNCADMLGSRKNENCVELADCEQCYESEHLVLCQSCIQSKFCYDCRNCQDCVGCIGLRNVKYSILNERYTPEEYQKKLKDLNLSTRVGRQKFQEEFNKLLASYPRKFSNSRRAVNSTGDYLNDVNNCVSCFDIEGPAEDMRYVAYGLVGMRDIQDAYAIGVNIEHCYDIMDVGSNVHNVNFSANVWDSYDCTYCYFANNSSNCFGCVGIKNKQYCIFNKQYTKEEYEILVPKIIEHMNKMPFVDSKGNSYVYGEYFPMEFSFFPYNESIAQEYFTLSTEEAKRLGYVWRDLHDKSYIATKKISDLPETIAEMSETILNETIACEHAGNCQHQCTKAFRVISPELQLYKKLGIPIPILCVNCRHYERLAKRNPLKLWHRACMCGKIEHGHEGSLPESGGGGCPNEFETSYAPERPEIIYCEKCYQQEVM